MEEPQSDQINGGGGSGSGSGGDEFYEEIEAPKFVDFTTPDHFCPDDRFWFCMRVGCDQKHEEELDPEAIYKNFVLRVMAARSPNVKIRKALNRKSPSLKCPLTAPAKSSKPRVSRMALLSSISHKLVAAKDKAIPLRNTKISPTTPVVKTKQPSSVAKALTTPRNRKPISNPDMFRSVRNPKPKDAVVLKNRVVAKALVFHSPKKAVKTKSLLDRGSNVGKLSAAMKKLDIRSGKKPVLGCTKKPLPLDTPRKQFRGREVKSRVFNSLHSNKDKGQEVKSSLKRKKMEEDLRQCCDNDSSDTEIDEKLRKCSTKLVSFESDKVNGDVESCEASKTSESSFADNKVKVVSETSKAEISSLSSPGENDSEENCYKEKTKDGNGHVSSEKTTEELAENDKENAGASANTEYENDNMHKDDKENCITSEDNRERKLKGHSKKKNLGNHSASKNSQKVIQVAENTSSAPTSAQGVKYSKPKPTNPKPFRFRTDEREMLKGANLEKKVHTPLKEISLDTLPVKSITDHHNVIQTNKNCLGKIDYESDSQSGEKRRPRLDQNRKVGATCSKNLKPSKGDLEHKLSETTPPNRSSTVLTEQKPQKERSKSPIVQPRFARPRRVGSSKKNPCQLSIIKESATKNIRSKKTAKPCDVSSATKARTPSRSLSRGRRPPATIPKEPHFHTMHVPKDCTKPQKENDSTVAQQN